MEFIKILLTTCSIINTNFSSVGVSPNIAYHQELDFNNQFECQLFKDKGNHFVCINTKENKKTKDKQDLTPISLKLGKINDSIFVLSNESKTQIFQVNNTDVVYHERALSEKSSTAKVCIGKLEEKR